MPIEIDDNEVIVPCSTPLPGGAPASAPDGDTRAPREVSPPGTSLPAPTGWPAMESPSRLPGGSPATELTPARSVAARPSGSPRITDGSRAGDDLSAEEQGGRGAEEIKIPSAPSPLFPSASSFRRASEIAAHLGCSTKSVHRRAEKEGWPAQGKANRREYIPPFEISTVGRDSVEPSNKSAVTFTGIALHSPARDLALQRERAVQHFESLVSNHGVEVALSRTVSHFASAEPVFHFSARSLRRWRDAYATLGLNGLIDQKQGRVGRKPLAAELTEQTIRSLRAGTMQHGSVARAKRSVLRDPRLNAAERRVLAEINESKSYVPPSVREVAKVSGLACELYKGPHAARLAVASVHLKNDVPPGAVYVADDMTPNVYVWEPWPGKLGFRIGRPQILAVNDVGSLMPLRFRVIMRWSGAYTSDDVAGVLGDCFDDQGLPGEGLLLEGGVWRANKIIGYRTVNMNLGSFDGHERGFKTEIDPRERIGGLAALGLKVHWAHTPQAKWQIEGSFNQLQYIMDRCAGYCGRDERTTRPEITGKRLTMCENGQAHPSEFFLSLREFADHVQTALIEMAHERQDGQWLRGASPFEHWMNDRPTPRFLEERDKWMYRDTRSLEKITKNGVRCTRGTGARQDVIYFHNPDLFRNRGGQRVQVFWNDGDHERDAIILGPSLTSPTKFTFIGTAQFQHRLSRFHASKEEITLARSIKNEQMKHARSELRGVESDLVQTRRIVTADAEARRIGEAIRVADEDATTRANHLEAVRRNVRRDFLEETQHPDMT